MTTKTENTAKPSHDLEFLPNERWWGGRIADGHLGPFHAESAYRVDLHNSGGNQVMPLFVSSCGRALWSEVPFAMTIESGRMRAETSPSVAEYRPGSTITLSVGGSTLRDAYRSAVGPAITPTGTTPAEMLLTRPQYNLWIELLYEPTQDKVLAYAAELLKHSYPPGVLMIDDNWSLDYGRWEFDRAKFPDPAAMVRSLHDDGFRIMLWVCPFVSPAGRKYLNLRNANLLLRDTTGNVAIRPWWNGFSALYDLTNPVAVEHFVGELQNLQKRYGIDGFKIDAGDISHYKADDRTHRHGAMPFDQTHAFGRLATAFEYVEVKAAYRNAGLPLAQRLRDKHHEWSRHRGVASLIPHTLAQAMTGHAFTCPDMIGGGEYLEFMERTEPVHAELFVRYAQIAACMPMMQFSAAPWSLLDDEHQALCREAAALHVELAPYIFKLASAAANTGEPIVTPMEYHFPHAGLSDIDDQFMLGKHLLVAPATEPGQDRRVVRLPPGYWIDEDGNEHAGSQNLEIPVPLSRLPRFTLQPCG
ncbi:MAG: glycoside hydrolase family 31 protein [Planctomycetota bacterium]